MISICVVTGRAAVNDAKIIGVAGTEGVTSGAQVTALVTLRNTGTTTWSQAAAYGLAVVDDPYAVLDLPYPRVGFPADVTVAPGAEITLPLALRAPASVLTVSVKLRMVQEFVEFFGETYVLRFEVGPGAPEPLPRAGFSAPFALDPHGMSELMAGPPPRIATDGQGHCIAVWASRHHATIDTGADADIIMARSADGGRTWSDPAPLNTNATVNDGQTDRDDDRPDIAAIGNGQWIAVWESNSTLGKGNYLAIFHALSEDDGVTWSAPQVLYNDPTQATVNELDPKVTCGRDATWMVAWAAQRSDVYQGDQVRSVRSDDWGKTWRPAGTIMVSGSATQLLRLVADGNGSWMCATMAVYSGPGVGRTVRGLHFYRQRNNSSVWEYESARGTAFPGDRIDDNVGLNAPAPRQWARSFSGASTSFNFTGFEISRNDGASWTSFGYSILPFEDPTRAYYLGLSNIVADAHGNVLGIIRNTGALGGALGGDNDVLAVRLQGRGADRDQLLAVNANSGFDSGDDAVPEFALNDDGSAVAVWTSTERFGDRLPEGSRILVATADKLFVQSNAALGWSGYK